MIRGVGPIIDFMLSQCDPVLAGPRADHMDRVLTDGMGVPASHYLAINRHNLSFRLPKHNPEPATEPGLKHVAI